MPATLLWLCHSDPIPNCLVIGPSPLGLGKKDKVMEKAGIPKELKDVPGTMLRKQLGTSYWGSQAGPLVVGTSGREV